MKDLSRTKVGLGVVLALVAMGLGTAGLSVGAQDSVNVYLLNLKVRAELNAAGDSTQNVDVCVDDEEAPRFVDVGVAQTADLSPASLTAAPHDFFVFAAVVGKTCTERRTDGDATLAQSSFDLSDGAGAAVFTLYPTVLTEGPGTEYELTARDLGCPNAISVAHAAETTSVAQLTNSLYTPVSGTPTSIQDRDLSPGQGVTVPDESPGTLTLDVALPGEGVVLDVPPVAADPTTTASSLYIYGGPTQPIGDAQTGDPTFDTVIVSIPVACPAAATTTTTTTTTASAPPSVGGASVAAPVAASPQLTG